MHVHTGVRCTEGLPRIDREARFHVDLHPWRAEVRLYAFFIAFAGKARKPLLEIQQTSVNRRGFGEDMEVVPACCREARAATR